MDRLTRLYDPCEGIMGVAGFMSGSGTNLVKIIEHERKLKAQGRKLFEVVVIFSDVYDSNAAKIGRDFDIPVVIRDINSYYAARGVNDKRLKIRGNYEIRQSYERDSMLAIESFCPDVVAYAGYMSAATDVFVNAFLGVNVHPADLSVLKEDGKRKYTGDNAVAKAILASEQFIYSTTHLVSDVVDGGKLLMRSVGLEVVLDRDFDPNDPEKVKAAAKFNQGRLKEVGDWEIFPKTLEYIAEGRIEKDKQGNLYFDKMSVPNGIRL